MDGVKLNWRFEKLAYIKTWTPMLKFRSMTPESLLLTRVSYSLQLQKIKISPPIPFFTNELTIKQRMLQSNFWRFISITEIPELHILNKRNYCFRNAERLWVCTDQMDCSMLDSNLRTVQKTWPFSHKSHTGCNIVLKRIFFCLMWVCSSIICNWPLKVSTFCFCFHNKLHC